MHPRSSQRGQVEPFLAMDVLAAAARHERHGRRVIHMEVGQPDAPAPTAVLEAARAALSDGRLGYTPAVGLEGLRRRIARHYRDAYGVRIPAERVVVTTGSSAGFVLAFLAALDSGEGVLTAAPGYPAYRNLVGALGLKLREVGTGPSRRWSLTPEDVDAHAAAVGAVLLASPNNPTGTVIPADGLKAIAESCIRHGKWLISDEIYHGLVYDGEAATALSWCEDAIVINSFSKYYCMTGWRIGWMIVPERLVRTVERLAQNLYISPPDLSQRAAIAAFDATAELEAVKQGYARNRRLLRSGLADLGFEDAAPVDGAFYVYAGIRQFSNDSIGFARQMLDEAGVAATPGVDFDPDRGNGFMRFSFAGSEESMSEGLARLRRWLEGGRAPLEF